MVWAILATAAHRLPQVRCRNRLSRGLISALAQGQTFQVRRGDVNYEVCGVDLIDYYIMSQVLRACPGVRAVAIEPSPAAPGRLLRNIQQNPDLQARCQVLGAAMADTKGLTEVLQGFGDLLDRDMRIVFEHNLYRFAERGRPTDEVARFSTGKGFVLRTLEGGQADLTHDEDFVAVKGAFLEVVEG